MNLAKKKKNELKRVPVVPQWVKTPTSLHEDLRPIPGLAQWVEDLVWW